MIVCYPLSGGLPITVDGTSCPTGYSPNMPSSLGGAGVAEANGQSIPANADKRPYGMTQYSGSQLSTVTGGSVYQGVQNFENMRIRDPEGYKTIVQMMRDANLLTEREKSPTTISQRYRQVLEVSAEYAAQGTALTPTQILKDLSEGKGSFTEDPATARTGVYRGPTYSIDLTNETEAYTLLNDMARDMIGRDLTEEEIAKYTRKLNKAEAAAPRVATPQGQAGTVYSGGVDRNEVVRQLITENPDYAGFQLNHQVMDTILGELDEGQSFLNEWS